LRRDEDEAGAIAGRKAPSCTPRALIAFSEAIDALAVVLNRELTNVSFP
jgi:hypothetical protein